MTSSALTRPGERSRAIVKFAEIDWALTVVLCLLAGWGAELDYTCNDGTTPLMLAAVKGHLAVVQALCESGAALEATSHSGATALEMAEGQGHAAVVQYLRERASL